MQPSRTESNLSDEKELIERARGRDERAFESLYRQNVEHVYALCLRVTACRDEAESLTQDVFVRAWQKLDSFRGESTFRTWLLRIAINAALQERRSRRRREARIQLAGSLSSLEGATLPSATEDGITLERAIASLPPGARKVFLLHEVQGYRHDEVSRMTGLAVGTLKAQLHRARKLLRKILE